MIGKLADTRTWTDALLSGAHYHLLSAFGCEIDQYCDHDVQKPARV